MGRGVKAKTSMLSVAHHLQGLKFSTLCSFFSSHAQRSSCQQGDFTGTSPRSMLSGWPCRFSFLEHSFVFRGGGVVASQASIREEREHASPRDLLKNQCIVWWNPTSFLSSTAQPHHRQTEAAWCCCFSGLGSPRPRTVMILAPRTNAVCQTMGCCYSTSSAAANGDRGPEGKVLVRPQLLRRGGTDYLKSRTKANNNDIEGTKENKTLNGET